jgi:hypothetical protein
MISEEEARHLEAVSADLRDLVQGLRDDMARAANVRNDLTRLTKSGRLTRAIVVVQSVIIVLMLGGGALLLSTNIKLNSVVAQLNEVVRIQHDSALCPLYQIFINADTPAARAAAEKRGDDMEQRDRSFATIRQSYAALNCQAIK